MGILDKVNQELEQMTPEQLKEAFLAQVAQKAKRDEKQKEYNSKPENKEKRKQYMDQQREKDPEGFKAKRDAYNKKPEVVERRKEYMKSRNETLRLTTLAAARAGIPEAVAMVKRWRDVPPEFQAPAKQTDIASA